jgi:flagellar biosynthesis/type III secretory pathway M-ring protein FliF/YscJ
MIPFDKVREEDTLITKEQYSAWANMFDLILYFMFLAVTYSFFLLFVLYLKLIGEDNLEDVTSLNFPSENALLILN